MRKTKKRFVGGMVYLQSEIKRCKIVVPLDMGKSRANERDSARTGRLPNSMNRRIGRAVNPRYAESH